jgi:hypothetical protein
LFAARRFEAHTDHHHRGEDLPVSLKKYSIFDWHHA